MKKFLFGFMLILAMLVMAGCEHKHSYEDEVIEPTCTEAGYTKHVCECGESYDDTEVPAVGHKYGEWTVVEEATEEDEGLKERYCSVCNVKEEASIPTLEHVHKYEDKVHSSTCTEDGYTEHTCKCGDTYNSDVVKAHHTEEELQAVDATCTQEGLSAGKQCKVCKEVLVKQNTIPALGHKYGEWTITKQPTIEAAGEREKECSTCHDKITEELEKLDDPNAEEYKVIYDLNGGNFVGGYVTFDELGDAFLASFNKASSQSLTKEDFMGTSAQPIKAACGDSAFLAEWNWLFKYMLNHLTQYNTEKGSLSNDYVADTLTALNAVIAGDTNIMSASGAPGPNARTLIRSYIHSVLNKSKGSTVNPTFAGYTPDLSDEKVQEDMLKNQYNLEVTLDNGVTLPVPVREGYAFKGWQNKYGDIVTIAKNNGKLIAVWEEQNPVENVQITNKVEEINLFEEYQLEWTLSPSNAGDKRVKFSSSDKTIATIDENGLVQTLKVGTVTFTITSLSKHGYTDTMEAKVITPGYFDINYETNSFVLINETVKLKAEYIGKDESKTAVDWSSLNDSIATVTNEGVVTGLSAGKATIRATVKNNAALYQDIIVTVLDQETYNNLQVILNAHNSNIFTRYNLLIGDASSPAYFADIFGSVSKLLYNKNLEIDNTYNKATNDKYGDQLESRKMSSIEFITVHYTAGFGTTANAKAHGAYFAQPLSENATSIHYSTGNDGIYKGLDEKYRAAHAGDDGSFNTVNGFSWIDTPVEVLPTDPKFPVVTITSNATFAINGRDTEVKVPNETKFNRGYVTDSKWLNNQGIAVNINDNKYQIGTTWWCYTQVSEGRICSNGGNANSIGIESAVNYGSDLWYTWQITAQLVADIMSRYSLDITRVKGHHFFSAKNCPQPMLENDLEIWWEFIDLVQAEYDKLTNLKNCEISFTSNSEYVNDKGRVVNQPLTSQVVTYTVSVKKDSKTYTVELASVLEGMYNR